MYALAAKPSLTQGLGQPHLCHCEAASDWLQPLCLVWLRAHHSLRAREGDSIFGAMTEAVLKGE